MLVFIITNLYCVDSSCDVMTTACAISSDFMRDSGVHIFVSNTCVYLKSSFNYNYRLSLSDKYLLSLSLSGVGDYAMIM